MSATNLIVVGVDGSDGGRRALTWAVEEAGRTGATVQAVSAWQWDGLDTAFLAESTPTAERERAERVAAHEVSEVIAGHGTRVPIAQEVIEGRPADVLTSAARTAHMLVLGSHGHSRIRHAVLGSVTEECVHRAVCPVVVIPVPHNPIDPREPATLP
ncbi:universal stress protein [Longispora sp. K20-0274]|uniref:universal stress protein n=1 Tax=Longispora sp. K20-0274 TaxID=3088255 RepID=UPI00399A7A91